MQYYKILVASNKYHGNTALTYSSETPLTVGQVVLVPLRTARVTGVVISEDTTPTFMVKPVIGVQIREPVPKECLSLLTWLGAYYPSSSSSLISLFVPATLKLSENKQPSALRATTKSLPELPRLTEDQQQALTALKTSNSVLLHGDTGTGKTRVYLEAAKQTLTDGRNIVILTPEIGLTSQLAKTFTQNVCQPVLVLHSNLTGLERRTLWQQIQTSPVPFVLIGPRSALFAPLKNVGLIVVDEAHDAAYKQDQAPYYHALRVAGKLAQIHKASFVLGTATPPVSEYYIMQQKQVPIVRLTQTATGGSPDVHITVVDAKDRSNYSTNPYFSDSLLQSIRACLDASEQSLIFLNRRGTARTILCQSCSWQAMCPRCELPLTYHGDTHVLRCHTCGHSQTAMTSCPACSNTDIVYRSIGTKAVVTMLQQLFPEAKIQRFDTDNTKSEKLEHHYENVHSGKVDILVGTQMLVKGLDLPRLGLVGVVAADSSLQFPDFTAEEQTYQLLTQVVGRVGRGHRHGAVVIQTHDVAGASLQAVINKDWDTFYSQQLAQRKKFLFPPYCFLLHLTCSRKTQASAIKASLALIETLKKSGLRIEIVGPSPRFNEQQRGSYNWQLIVKAKQRQQLLEVIAMLPANWSYDIDPTSLI